MNKSNMQTIEEFWEMLAEKHQRLQTLHEQLSGRVGLQDDPAASRKMETLSRTMGDLVRAVDQCQNDLLDML
jgi:hypothetical protein